MLGIFIAINLFPTWLDEPDVCNTGDKLDTGQLAAERFTQ